MLVQEFQLNVVQVGILDFVYTFIGKALYWSDTEIPVVHMAFGLAPDRWNSNFFIPFVH